MPPQLPGNEGEEFKCQYLRRKLPNLVKAKDVATSG